MLTPYQLVHPDARKVLDKRRVFFLRKARECEDVLRTLDALPSLLDEHAAEDASPPEDRTDTITAVAEQVERDHDAVAADDPLLAHHRLKEDLYDEEMLKLLAQVKVASKQAVYQHFHRAFRGNISVGAVESYLKRAVLRGLIVRPKRGEYRLPPQTD